MLAQMLPICDKHLLHILYGGVAHVCTAPWRLLLLLCCQGLIHVSELLAPSHLVEGEEAEDEAEAYTEVDNIDPAAYYKVRLVVGSSGNGCNKQPQ